MKKRGVACLLVLLAQPLLAADAVDELLAGYSAESAAVPDPLRGEALWKERHGDRSCSTCHGSDLMRPGKHVRTGKKIQPMARSVNPRRLTRQRKIEKWFLRNCKWTWGRTCTAREKADILAWLKQQ
jgi:hypothetical protein